jgi:tight adherence protein B
VNETALQSFLLIGGCLSLIGLGVSGLMLSRAHVDNERRSKRISELLEPHVRTAQVELSAFTLTDESNPRDWSGSLGKIFGFHQERAELYPVHWAIVVMVTFLLGMAARYAADSIFGSLSWLLLPTVWIGLSRTFFNQIETKRRDVLLSQFPDALAMIVRSIRVGVPVIDAIRNVSLSSPPPTAGEFANLVEQISLGTPLDEAITELANRTGLAEYRFFATSISLQTQTGGTLSETLENLADVIRKRAALKARGYALTAEARTSSMILALLPFIIGGMLYVINPSYIMLLFTDPTGKTFFSSAVISLTLGVLTIRAIIKKVLP